jgi:DNA polymerase III alpha subunit (gram-positive type)
MASLEFFREYTMRNQLNPELFDDKVNASFLCESTELARIRIVFFDIETSPAMETKRPDGNTDSIIEIAAVSDGYGTFSSLCNPGHSIFTTHCNGITDDDVKDKPLTNVVVRDFFDWILPNRETHDISLLIAHNAANFDLKLLRTHFSRLNLESACVIVADSLHPAYRLSGAPAAKLESIYKHLFNNEYIEKHRALDDAKDLERIIAHLATCADKSIVDILANHMYPLHSSHKFQNVYIDVPFSSKDEAKKLGAKWDPGRRSWYAGDKRALEMLCEFPVKKK